MAIPTPIFPVIEDVVIDGHERSISLRSYTPALGAVWNGLMPIVIYFHGGRFTGGTVQDGDPAAKFISANTPAWVVSVDYSLAPSHPFPAAIEDAYLALAWVAAHARERSADVKRIGVAGHDAGGNLATCLTAVARDRGEYVVVAQSLLAPLLDPSMTRLAISSAAGLNAEMRECAECYMAYLPKAAQRLHPYAAPIESRRLSGLPPALVASAANDKLCKEAETYAAALISAGVSVEVTRHKDTSHQELATLPAALDEVVAFFRRRFGALYQT